MPGVGDALAWDRYAYVKYNPIKYMDTSGKVFTPPSTNIGMTDGDWDSQLKKENQHKENPVITGLFDFAIMMNAILELAVSGAGVVMNAGLTLAGEAVTPIPGTDGAAGELTGIALYAQTLDQIENALGWNGVALEILQGFYTGDNYINFQTGEVFICEDTTTELIFAAVGSQIPEPGLDFTLNSLSFSYGLVSMGDIWQGPVSISYDPAFGASINYNQEPIITFKNYYQFINTFP